MHSATGSVAAGATFPVEVLMKSAPPAIATSEARVTARFLHRDDLVVDLTDATREERAAVDHHVDLVCAGLDRRADVRELHLERRLTGWERRRNRRDIHRGACERAPRDRDEARVDAHGRDGRNARVA